ncbi:MAG: ribonuclease P protein component, partial [Patescibacteria group bacterium]
FAFVVSKKTDARATHRNSLKRKVRSCIEEIFDNIKTGNDFIFYPKKQTEEADRDLVFQEINKFFKKANLLKK